MCTNQGLVRNYNEDRVAIVLNILKPSNKDQDDYWPNCSIFGVFDGHGGAKCAEYLRNNLHHFVRHQSPFELINRLSEVNISLGIQPKL